MSMNTVIYHDGYQSALENGANLGSEEPVLSDQYSLHSVEVILDSPDRRQERTLRIL
jgi:hypothetical protein